MTILPRRFTSGLRVAGCWLITGLTLLMAAAVHAQDFGGELGLDLFKQGGNAAVEDPKLTVTAFPKTGKLADLKPGDEIILAVKLSFPPGTYTYSQATPHGGKTLISLKTLGGLQTDKLPLDRKKENWLPTFEPSMKPKRQFDKDFEGDVEKFTRPVTWTASFPLADGATADEVKIAGVFKGQTCNDRGCRPLTIPINVTLTERPADADAPAKSSDKPADSLVTAHREAVVDAGRFEQTRDFPAGKATPATMSVRLQPANASVGETVTLSVQVELQEGWHTYSVTQPEEQFAQKTTIPVADTWGLSAIDDGFTPATPPKVKQVEIVGEQKIHETHEPTVTWSQRFVVTEDAGKKGYGVVGQLDFQFCHDKKGCVPAKGSFVLGGNVGKSSASPSTPAVAATNTPPDKPTVDIDAGAVAEEDQSSTSGLKSSNLLVVMLTAALGGGLALLTPCVFPMIPITVTFFLKQAEKNHRSPLPLALVYCATIIFTFTALGLIIGAIWGAAALTQLAGNVWVNLFLTGVLLFFGISMLGFFEIALPGRLTAYTSGKEQVGGVVGTIFMALTFTLVSFTCTFPIAGLVLVAASKGEFLRPVLAMLAFSTVFALPFFALALLPSYLKKLPKSGGWMNNVKVVFGLLEIGAALKLLSVAELSWFRSQRFLTDEVVLLLWFAIAVLIVLYIVGMLRFPHDSQPKMFSPLRVLLALPFVILAVNLAKVDAYPNRIDFKTDEWILALLPLSASDAAESDVIVADLPDEVGPTATHSGVVYAQDFQQATTYSLQANEPMLLDFTGVNCSNCRGMEKKMRQPEFLSRIKELVRVQIYTDEIPADQIADPAAAEVQLSENQQLQQELLEDVTLPGYAIVTPDGKTVLARHPGVDNNGSFVRFLDRGLARWQARSAPKTAAVPAMLPLSASTATEADVIVADLPDEVGPTATHRGVVYAQDFQQATSYSVQANAPLFLDFTSMNCSNCRVMEKRMRQPEFLSRIKELVRVQIYTDIIPADQIADPAVAELQLDANQQLQQELLEDVTLPGYAIVTPDGKTVLARHPGVDNNGSFVRFLDRGLARWQARSAPKTAAVPAATAN